MENRTAQTECFTCHHRQSIPGDGHIRCTNPDRTVGMNGHPHGIKRGWFFYPFNFDPTWKQTICQNYCVEQLETL